MNKNQWYVLKCNLRKEEYVKRIIVERIKNYGFGNLVFNVVVMNGFGGFIYINMVDVKEVDCIFSGLNYSKGFIVDDSNRYDLRVSERLRFRGGKKLSLRKEEVIRLGLNKNLLN